LVFGERFDMVNTCPEVGTLSPPLYAVSAKGPKVLPTRSLSIIHLPQTRVFDQSRDEARRIAANLAKLPERKD
jgi:hypothetical protein